MTIVLAYLCRRAREWTTWVGLVLFLVFIGAIVFYRQDILLLLGAPLSGLLAALPDRLLKLPWLNLARVAANAIFRTLKKSADLPPAIVLPIAAEVHRSIPMSSPVVQVLETAMLEGAKAAVGAMTGPIGAAAKAVLAAAEDHSAANILAAVSAVVAAVESAQAEVPPGYVPATEAVAVPASEPAV